jgi:mannosylglycerate hydrolase
VVHQIISREEAIKCAYLKFGSHINYEASRVTVALDVKEVPPFGYVTLRVCPLIRSDRPIAHLSPVFGVMENEYLKAEIKPDGTVDLLHKETGAVYKNLHFFEDSGEQGGPLIFDPPKFDNTYRSRGCATNIAKKADGPLLSEYVVEYVWPLPEAVESEVKIRVPNGQELLEYGTLRRSKQQRIFKISSRIILRRNSRILEFETTVDNTIKDHRLRVIFPTGLSGATHSYADSAFDIAQRPITVPDSTGWYEAALKTWPVQSFVDVNHDGYGLAVLHEGLSEYEVIDDDERAVALTLLRCFGTAGAPFETYEPQPLAQCQGIQRFRYAVFPHSGDCVKANVLREACCFTVPLRIASGTGHSGTLPRKLSFIQPDQDRFQVTCLKLSEDGRSIILRGHNPERNVLPVNIKVCRSVFSATKVTLEEKEVGPLVVSGGDTFRIEVRPGEIFSCAIVLKGEQQ